MKKLFYILVGLAAASLVYNQVMAIADDIFYWWDNRNTEYTPTTVSVSAPRISDEEEIIPQEEWQKIFPELSRVTLDESLKRFLVIPVQVQNQNSSVGATTDLDEIVVTGSSRGRPGSVGLPNLDRFGSAAGGLIEEEVLRYRSCSGTSYPNLLVHDRDTQRTIPVFTVPLAIVNHRVLQENDQNQYIAFAAAILDTRRDGILNCQDHLFFGLYNMESGSLKWFDLGGDEPLLMDRGATLTQLSASEYLLGIGLDDDEDGYHESGQEMQELAVLNVKTNELRRVVTAEHLAEVQNILYRSISLESPASD